MLNDISTPTESRRTFLANSLATSAMATATTWGLTRSTYGQTQEATRRRAIHPWPDDVRVIDCHAHLRHHSFRNWETYDQSLIDAADVLGIDVLCCSMLTPTRPATPEGYQECNRWVADAVQRFPDRVWGYSYVNPGTGQAALDEVRRCIEQYGFMGIKLYNEHFCTDPVVFPIVELAIELKVPILQHAGHMHYFVEAQPRISDGGHIAELAKRYPEATIICAHICGGGDWEWTIKSLRHASNVYLDTSGSVTDDGVLELAASTLGTDRLVFGCDMSMTAGVGRMRGVNLPVDEKRKILGANMQQILSHAETRNS